MAVNKRVEKKYFICYYKYEVIDLKELYGVKAIITYLINGTKKIYEDMVLSVKAESFDNAYEKAKIHIEKSLFDYTNPFGESVEAVGFELLDCYLASDEESGVCEVYSTFITNKTTLKEEEYYEAITDQLSSDEAYVLRNIDFN